jgi:hypothetical protein
MKGGSIMRMRRGYLLVVVVLVVLAFGVGRLSAAPGTMDSPAPPGATSSYSLEDIYHRINDGSAGAQSGFTEPSSGPAAGTMHTLDDIYELVGKRAPVGNTGQSVSHAVGDDGYHWRGVRWPHPRFTDNWDGTVTDNLTGLIWLKNADCWGFQNWVSALTYANGLKSGSCGLSDGSQAGDWRLPNVREIQSLVNYGVYNPAVPDTWGGTEKWSEGDPFTGVQSIEAYWSSTTNANNSSYAWYVRLLDGYVVSIKKTSTYFVWPVRGGQ